MDAGDSLEWKLKQKTGHDAEIDIIASVIIGMVPQAVDLGRFAGGGIGGVIQRQQLFRRVLHQVQAAVQQTVGQRAVLLVDKADLALVIPEGDIIIFSGKAGVARLPERHNHHKGGEDRGQHRTGGAVADIACQPAAVPQAALRAQSVDGQQRQENSDAPQQRELQRARRVGGDAGKGDGHREGCKGRAVAGGGQLHCADVARQVQADNLAAGRLGRDLPGAEVVQLRVGFIGGIDAEVEEAVPMQRIGIIVGQAVHAQVIDRLVDVKEPHVGVVLVQRDTPLPPDDVDVGVQVFQQLERLVAVGVEVGHVAYEHLAAQGRRQQQRHHEPQSPAAKAAQPGHTEGRPAAQCRDGRQAESIKPDGQPRAMVGAQGKHPGGQPQASRPAKITLPYTAASHFGRGQPQCQRDNSRKDNG